MQTTTPLTEENRRVILQMKRQDKLNALYPFLFGILLIALPCVWFIDYLITASIIDIEPILMFLALVAMGIFIGHRAKLKTRKIDNLYTDLLNKEKLVLSGFLRHVDVVYKQYVSYTLEGYTAQVYVPLATYRSKLYDYRRELETIKTATNMQVSLHLVTIKPGVIVLLEALYESAIHETKVLTFNRGEKKQALWKLCITLLKVFGLLLVISTAIGFLIDVEAAIFLLELLTVLLLLYAFVTQQKRLREISTYDSRIKTSTTVCEVLEAWRRNRKVAYLARWYRLGNGMIVQCDNLRLNCGDMLVTEHIEKENGKQGALLTIKKEQAPAVTEK